MLLISLLTFLPITQANAATTTPNSSNNSTESQLSNLEQKYPGIKFSHQNVVDSTGATVSPNNYWKFNSVDELDKFIKTTKDNLKNNTISAKVHVKHTSSLADTISPLLAASDPQDTDTIKWWPHLVDGE